MPSRYVLAILFVAAFYGVGLVPEDNPLYRLLGIGLVLGVIAIGYGILHPVRRR